VVLQAWHRGRDTDAKQSAAGKLSRRKYRRRNTVERCIGWLKCCRRIATRHEKLATTFLAMVKLAMIQRCLRLLDP
jgi:transposase